MTSAKKSKIRTPFPLALDQQTSNYGLNTTHTWRFLIGILYPPSYFGISLKDHFALLMHIVFTILISLIKMTDSQLTFTKPTFASPLQCLHYRSTSQLQKHFQD